MIAHACYSKVIHVSYKPSLNVSISQASLKKALPTFKISESQLVVHQSISMAGVVAQGTGTGEQIPPGKSMSVEQQVLDKGAQMLQSLTPIKQISQHVCTFAIYSHEMNRQIETHHFVTRLNQDFLQCAVYDSDQPHARLIGILYVYIK